jgi:hypothetical protein
VPEAIAVLAMLRVLVTAFLKLANGTKELLGSRRSNFYFPSQFHLIVQFIVMRTAIALKPALLVLHTVFSLALEELNEPLRFHCISSKISLDSFTFFFARRRILSNRYFFQSQFRCTV